jgi:hypothetical protein
MLGKRLLREHVEGGARDPSFPERLYQRGLVDYGPSSNVYEPCAGLHPLELGGAEHAPRLIRERRRDDDVIGVWERLIRKYCTNSEKRTTYPFVRDRVILPAAAVREENTAGGRYTRP